MSTGEAMLEQLTTIKGCASIAEYYRDTLEFAPVEYNRTAAEPEKQNTLGVGRLCKYSRVLKEHSEGCDSKGEYHRSIGKLCQYSELL